MHTLRAHRAGHSSLSVMWEVTSTQRPPESLISNLDHTEYPSREERDRESGSIGFQYEAWEQWSSPHLRLTSGTVWLTTGLVLTKQQPDFIPAPPPSLSSSASLHSLCLSAGCSTAFSKQALEVERASERASGGGGGGCHRNTEIDCWKGGWQ